MPAVDAKLEPLNVGTVERVTVTIRAVMCPDSFRNSCLKAEKTISAIDIIALSIALDLWAPAPPKL
jgi:hypothetical protein